MADVPDRRGEAREQVEATVFLTGEEQDWNWRVRGSTADVSGSGISVKCSRRLRPGAIMWCAVPGRQVYTRVQVVYSKGHFANYRIGLRFLACPWPQ